MIIFQDGTPDWNRMIWAMYSIEVSIPHVNKPNMCSTSSVLHYKHQTVYLLCHCRTSSIGGAELHTHDPISADFNRSVDSCNKVLLWRYRSTIHHTLHTVPQKIVERRQIWWLRCPRNCSPSTNPSIWICNVEVIPHIFVKIRRLLKGCISAVLGHQIESNKLWHPFVFKRRRSTAPCVTGQGFLLEQWSLCRPAQHTKRCWCFLGNSLYIECPRFRQIQLEGLQSWSRQTSWDLGTCDLHNVFTELGCFFFLHAII